MKKMKFNFAIAAVLLGIGTAALSVGTVKAKSSATLYGYNQATSQWEEVRPGYICDESSENCTAQFDTPPSQGGQPIPNTLVDGDFTNGL